MATGTGIKDRCRLCYTRLKDISSSHRKLWCSQHNHRLYNIYKRRPYRYRDLIVRYLSIRLPENENSINENNSIDHYSHVVCGTCAASLNKLDAAFRTFQQTQNNLRLKFRKTTHIIHYQLEKQIQKSMKENQQEQLVETKQQIQEEKNPIPKRQSKRKGAPKHIDQTVNNHLNAKKTTGGGGGVQLIVKMPSLDRNNHDDDDDDDGGDGDGDEQQQETKISTKRTSPRRKPFQTNGSEKTNPKKKFKRVNNNLDTSTNVSFKSINLLKPKMLTDLPINDKTTTPLHLTTISGSTSTNSRSFNSVKGNHIERIAVSLLSGTDALTDVANNSLNHSNGTNDYSSNHNSKKTLVGRPTKPSTLEVTTTNNILSSTIPSPSMDEDDLSIDDASNDSSNTNSSLNRKINHTPISNLNKNLSSPSTISATTTADGLTITAINQTGQKQVFMAKQLGNMKKYQCSLCEKIVTNIQIHVRRHTNDKPYPCTYCEKRFTNSGDLQIHVRIHTGEKPYACPLCLKSYRTIGNFNSHVKTHDSGVRPHRCELCNQTFTIPKDWYSHLRSSHRSRTANTTSIPSSSILNSTNTTTTATKPLFSNCLTSQQQHNEVFIPNKVKLEPINRSQLIIKSANEKTSSNDDNLEPVNMSKKEDLNDFDDDDDEEQDDDDDEPEENHHQSTHNLLASVSSPVHA
ncbi:unnamed protein product [Rotaria socialis]|uniref:C2H2-type domain-containing protein n=1 Tax=Rotaria socialis TaxID=392032 RepID=A0A821IWG2_9BILA|nr:unnamed protein product [Rotaria socialis]CAF3348284.1 unnamed protein product [Rotaria socialis]CAF3363646.1 unnamed protein product [Rotaria socialis]CAF3719651.1 unnamed protein product [Rotaria socialis]CAF4332654.1 unnamed protein product [Rotaria socialis]